jgi:hypothetical protein
LNFSTLLNVRLLLREMGKGKSEMAGVRIEESVDKNLIQNQFWIPKLFDPKSILDSKIKRKKRIRSQITTLG